MDKKIYSSKVLELFFDTPEEQYHIREIARQLRLHPNTVLKEANELIKENLLLKRKTKAFTELRANREHPLYNTLKKLSNLRRLLLSGLIDELHEAYAAPQAIILFGSYSRGEDTKRSDIDIAIITKRHIPKDWAHKSLKRHIQIHEIDLTQASKEFITNLANGIVLKGYLDI